MKPSSKLSASKVSKRRRPGTRPTAAEKAEYVDLIIRDFVSGLNVHEIAKKHGISTASVYRWQRQQDAIQLTLNKNSHPKCVDISSALDNLCSTPPSNNSAMRDALFQFLTWVRWPFEPEYHLAAMINCTASYLHQTQKSRQIEALSHDDSAFISKYLTLDVIARFSSPYAAFNPDFEIISNKISRYDDRQFFAEIVNYLLEDKLNISGKIYRPTLRSLQSLVEEGVFGEGWSMSTRTFEKYWRARAPSFPFLYVEQYHSPFDWSLNPQDRDFAQSVDEVIGSMQCMRDYIGKVRWVIEKLTDTLDPRAAQAIAFPRLPARIPAIPVKNPPISTQVQAKIAQLF